MRPLELLIALAAALYGAGRIVQERRRLTAMAELSGTEARTLHERHRRAHDRAVAGIALAFALAALALLAYAFHLENGLAGGG